MSLFDAGHGNPPVTLLDLLSIEDAPELLAPHCPQTGIPVWPNIRIAFFRQIMADLLFATGSAEPPGPRRSWRAAGALGRAAAHNAGATVGRRLRADVLISSDAIGDELRNGRWFNRYVDPFAELPSGDQAVVMTDMFDWHWHWPRHNERIYYHTPLQVGAALATRLFPRPTALRLARMVTTLACDRARSILGWGMGEERRAAFVEWSAGKIAGLPLRYRAYQRLMRRVRPRLLIASAGCYGAHAPLLAAARDLGIVTAEYQHGAISAGHDAYNFAPAVFASEAYRRTLPQYLLTYGRWWGTQVTAPVECVVLGNPARAAKLDRMQPSFAARHTVLILGDGVEFDLYLNLARDIAGATAGTGLEIALRPHPLERSGVLRRHGERVDNVRIDVTPDIYTSFGQAHTVVSEVSTGLFEAVGLVDRIILLNTAKARFAYPKHPFASACSTPEVIDLIQEDVAARPRVEAEALWAPDWSNSYRRFLYEKAGLND